MRRDVLAKGEWDETWVPSSPVGHTTLSCLLLYTANAICIGNDETLVVVHLREKTACQQTKQYWAKISQPPPMGFFLLIFWSYMGLVGKKPGNNTLITLINCSN